MNRFSLRTRLVALAVVLVAFAVTLVGVVTSALLSSYLFSQLDDRLYQTATDTAHYAQVKLGTGGAPPLRLDRDASAVVVQDDTVVAFVTSPTDGSIVDITTARQVL